MTHSITNQKQPLPSSVIVGITGASGAKVAQRVIEGLVKSEITVHLVVTDFGKRLLHDELRMKGVDLSTLAGDCETDRIIHHGASDVGACIASGSFAVDAMIVLPCSSNTLGAIASGLGHNLVCRAAAVTLKERRKLILCHRETPLSAIDIENMHRLSQAGAIIAPLNPGWYFNPTQVSQVIDFMASRYLDLLGVPNNMSPRWEG